MTREEFTKGITFMAIAYDKEFTQERIAVWYDSFKDDSFDNFRQAVKRLIPKKQFMPTIAEIKNEMSEISSPILQLDADTEWNNVLKAIRKYGSYKPDEAMKSLDPYTAKIVRQVGYTRICLSEAIQWERKEFIELFNINKRRDIEVLMLTDSTMTLAELARKAEIKTRELESKAMLMIEE